MNRNIELIGLAFLSLAAIIGAIRMSSLKKRLVFIVTSIVMATALAAVFLAPLGIEIGDTEASIIYRFGRPDGVFTGASLGQSDLIYAYKFGPYKGSCASPPTSGNQVLDRFPDWKGTVWVYRYAISFCIVVYLDSNGRAAEVFLGAT